MFLIELNLGLFEKTFDNSKTFESVERDGMWIRLVKTNFFCNYFFSCKFARDISKLLFTSTQGYLT